MVIKHVYSPTIAGELSGESLIYKRGVGPLLDQIRQCILQARLLVSPKKTLKKGAEATGNPELASRLNKCLEASLKSLGWGPLKAAGAHGANAKIDWFKSVPSTIAYGPKEIGLGLEVQFGNNYQFNADIQRISEAVMDLSIVAGVCVVASDELADYKADRGAFFSSEREKLDRFLSMLNAAGAAIIPGFVLIGIGPDGFTNTADGLFELEAPIFNAENGIALKPEKFEYLGTALKS